MTKPDSRPKVAAFEENSYVTWTIGIPEDKTSGTGEGSPGGFKQTVAPCPSLQLHNLFLKLLVAISGLE
jgi:hypothetical protein